MYTALATLLFLALEGLAIWFAFRAIALARTPQGSIGWAVFLVTAPLFAVPLYLYLGHSRYYGYVRARRSAAAQIERLFKPADGRTHALEPSGQIQAAFQHLAELPIVSGNAMDLLIDGSQAFDAIFEAINRAEKYIIVQFYIIRDDYLGQQLKDALIARAQEGIAVRLLYDAIGCATTPRAFWQEMRHAGIEAYNIHAKRRATNRFQVNFRNHRKIVITDGTTGFTGGLNVGTEYLGEDEKFGRWRDTHCRIEGPMVSQLQLVFAEDWYWATGEILSQPLNWTPSRATEDITGLILPTGPGDPLESGTLYFCNAIGAARQRVWIASPYFVPDVDILTALKLAAIRGVDVRILAPNTIDHYLPWLAAFAYFDEIRAAGVKVWRYADGFLHQKVLIVDDAFASIGTLNLDNRSCRLNFEVTAMFFDTATTARAAAMLEQDFRDAEPYEAPLSAQPTFLRIGAPVARLFAPIL